MRVKIVYVVDATGEAPDVARMGTVEDLPDALARAMIAEGTAVLPDPEPATEQTEAQVSTSDPQAVDARPTPVAEKRTRR